MTRESNTRQVKRNLEIVCMIDNRRMTMTAIAFIFDISKQRVQQIYRSEKARNVQNIRPTGDGQNNHPAEHGR